MPSWASGVSNRTGTGKPGTDPPTKLKTKLAQIQGHHPGC